MAQHVRTVEATLAVRVPVNAAGSLTDGATRIVERVDAVDRVKELTVCGLTPGLNDTVVDLEVRLTLARERETATAADRALAAGVGVRDVADVEAVEPDSPPARERATA